MIARYFIVDENSVNASMLNIRHEIENLGFDALGITAIATAFSELGYNIVKYAGRGEITLRGIRTEGTLTGIELEATDNGPGIADPEEALRDHTSSSGTLGLGLPGVRRLMDDFYLDSQVGRGTRVVATKLLNP